MPVVAAAICDGEGRLLLQQALPKKRHAGQWEFPGGKVENGETPRFALCREIVEELGLELVQDQLEPAGFADEAGDPALVLMLYTARKWRGVPHPFEGQKWGWFTPEQAFALPLAAMDRKLLEQLFP